jgi:HPt (histidine-containing phosphotransfer) domain-containing protein
MTGQDMAISDLMQAQARTAAGVEGAVLGVLAAQQRNREVKEELDRRDRDQIEEEIRRLKGQVPSVGSNGFLQIIQVQDFLSGLASARKRLSGGVWIDAARPPVFSSTDVGNLQFPPTPTARDNDGNLVSFGQNYRLGQTFALPEIASVFGALELPFTPSPAQLQAVFNVWDAFQNAAAQVTVIPALSGAQLATLASQIAGSPLAVSQLQNLFQSMMSQGAQAVMLALAGQGPLTAAQVSSIVNYFSSLIASIVGAGGSAAVAGWIASQSPALADPALDSPWPYTYVVSSLSGTPNVTVAGNLGAIVAGAQGVAVFKFIAGPTEQQTTRCFRLQITPTTTAGTVCRCFLPAPLKGQNAPKVRVQVEGIGVVAAGSPYPSNIQGGATPSFDIVTGTNPAATTAYNVICEVSQ